MGHQQSFIFYIFSIQYNGCSGVAASSISSFTSQSSKTVPSFFLYFHIVLMQPCQPGWKKRNWPDSDSFETWRLIRAIPHHQLPCPSLSSRHLSPYHLLISFPFNMTSPYCFWILLSCCPCHRYCALTGWSKHQQDEMTNSSSFPFSWSRFSLISNLLFFFCKFLWTSCLLVGFPTLGRDDNQQLNFLLLLLEKYEKPRQRQQYLFLQIIWFLVIIWDIHFAFDRTF